MVFAGLLNKKLAACISAEGQPAIGISAADARCFVAEPMVHNEVEGGLGFVGYLTGLNAPFIESLWHEGLLPVSPCLGLGSDNELYNINADHMAAACAEYLHADQLIYLTDVAGVLDGERVLSAVTCEEVERLVQCRVVSGGMILKAGGRQARHRRWRPRSSHRRGTLRTPCYWLPMRRPQQRQRAVYSWNARPP